MRQHTTVFEHEFIEGLEDTNTAWRVLAVRHQQRRAVAQIRMIETLFDTYFPADITKMSDTIDTMIDLCKHIYAQSPPTMEAFLLVSMIKGLGKHHEGLRSAATTYYIANLTAGPRWLMDRIIAEKTWKPPPFKDGDGLALISTGPVCENPRCGKTGHKKDLCWGPGGVYEGRVEEAKHVVADRKKSRNQGGGRPQNATNAKGARSNHNPFRKTTDGRTFFIEKATNNICFVNTSSAPIPNATTTSAQSPTSTSTSLALNAVATDAFPREWLLSCTLSDTGGTGRDSPSFEVCSLDFSRSDLSDTGGQSAFAVQRRLIGADFIINSGASVHISPDRRDFEEYQEIPPRLIRGVGGSISAQGVGNVRIKTSIGGMIVLRDVLHVLEAGVHLLSI